MPAERRRELPRWRARCRDRVAALLGDFPDPVPLRTETVEVCEGPAYRREKLVYDVEDVMSVPAYLLVPD